MDILNELEVFPADHFEDQEIDFKEWNSRSMSDSINLVIEMAVCMANGGGGTVVFGIKDQILGRSNAIIGVPPEVDLNRLKKAVYDSTDPKLTPDFEELRVPEGTGRLVIMRIFAGLPPYTDTSGKGKVRIGKDCQPLTGTLRRRIMVETGETDFTAEKVGEGLEHLISAAALEKLIDVARREKAPEELLRLNGMDLLMQLGVLQDGQLTRAGVLLAGTERALSQFIPGYSWTHLRMKGDTRYTDRADGRDAVPVAFEKILDRINADNPIFTLEHGLFHFEYRTYPEIALREAIANALCHSDFRIAGPILVKQYQDRIEISNPGGFIAGITPENILHHQPAARNPLLVDAMAKLRIVNRSNLGIGRMFEALLIEGKEPPLIHESGDSVSLTFMRREFSKEFRLFVADESKNGRILTVDQLLIIQYLLAHQEIDSVTAAHICQRPEQGARGVMDEMLHLGYVERGGTGRGTYWSLHGDLHRRLAAPGHPGRDRRIDWEAAKTRVLSLLIERGRRGEPGLSNEEIRRITHYDRNQVFRLMRQLRQENQKVLSPGKGKYARYEYKPE